MEKLELVKVLVAEDDFLVRNEIVRLLKRNGYEIIGQATTGLEAIDMTQALKPEVILMDIKMPELDGISATGQIQERCPTPVVILTAHETRDLLEKASEAGAGAYIVKPPSFGTIERAITVAMARHKDLMKLREFTKVIQAKNQELELALAEIDTLQGILPICMYCKKIRDDQGFWNQVEQYLADHSTVKFSHGICQECLKKHYPECNVEIDNE